MPDCQRCDYRADNLTEHARETGHPLCIVDQQRPLRHDEQQTCDRCTTNVRADLASIVETYVLLPRELEHNANADIPGGDALVMLADGNTNVGSHDTARWDNEPVGSYERANDPESVAATLASWEDDWRDVFGHPTNPRAANVETAAGYLNTHLHTAARTHPAFDQFAADLHRLVVRLQLTTATNDWPVTGAPCISCGDRRLQRAYRSAGLSDTWECPRCKRTYSHAEYLLAMRSELDERRRSAGVTVADQGGWGLPWQVAAMLSLPVETVRTWAKRLVIGARCDVESKALEVSWVDASDRVADRSRSGAA